MIPPKEFIKKIGPFSYLSEDELTVIMSGLEVELFRKGRLIYRKGQAREYVYLIFSGLVGLYDEDAVVDHVSKGEVFGVACALGSSYALSAEALEDTVCYLIPDEAFRKVLARNEKFSSFFTTFIDRKFRCFRKIASGEKPIDQAALVPDIERIIYKAPVVCTPETTIAEAAAEMESNGVSSIVAVDANLRPVGILTHTDLRRVILRGDRSDAASRFMSSPVIGVDARSNMLDALATMMEAGIDHLAIVKDERILGVVSRKDIQIQLQPSSSMVALFRKMVKARTVGELATIFHNLKSSTAKIALTEPDFYDLSRIISSTHDALVAKIIEMAGPSGGSGKDFVWVQMGSSGRKEQIIATDQDNALILREDRPAPWAAEVTAVLERVGIPRCPGLYMASNEKWSRGLSVWKEYFREWFGNPTPDHVRYLSVFLDMRPIFGDEEIYRGLTASIRSCVSPAAIKLLAYDAIEIEPPIGMFGIIGLRRGLDLKTYGIYPIVNGVRVLAVDCGLLEVTNTRQRLEALRERGEIDDPFCSDLLESYGLIQELRLKRHARTVFDLTEADNIIHARELAKGDLLLLKESLKIVSAFQKLLMKKYNVRRAGGF